MLSRSFRFHRPRGLMCSTGQCGWCECEVDGVPSVRSCRVPVRDGLVARGEHAWPSVERDLVSLVGLFSRWIPPTFYHHRFLRPRRLRKRYLDVLRWFGGRGRLTLDGRRAAGHAPRPSRRLEADVLVVGAGASGVAAATKAADSAATVILLDPDRVGARPCRGSRCWPASRPSAGTTAWSRRWGTMPRTRSRPARWSPPRAPTTGCRSSRAPTGRASWPRGW